jgi:thiamine transport system permease protein
VAIDRLLGRPGALNTGQAFALSTVLLALTAGSVLLVDRVRAGQAGRGPAGWL